MTSESDYRGKARAVFLAAIMVISVVGMSVAFSGAAAASTNQQPNFEPRDNPYQGQTIFANSSEISENDEYDLRIVNSFDDGNVSSSSSVEDLIAQDEGEAPIDLNVKTSLRSKQMISKLASTSLMGQASRSDLTSESQTPSRSVNRPLMQTSMKTLSLTVVSTLIQNSTLSLTEVATMST